MSTLIDGSCLLSPHPTGVPRVVRDLIQQRVLSFEEGATLFTLRAQPTPHPFAESGLRHLHRMLPSKLVHAHNMLGGSLEQLAPGRWTRLFLPNMNIAGIPRIPFDLLVHDLSFLVHPSWFSKKTQLWHRFAQPKELIARADRLYTLSTQTTQALVDMCSVPKSRITQLAYKPTPLTQISSPRPIEHPYVLLLASNDPRKNRVCVERAFASFFAHHPEWRLVLVGGARPSNTPGQLHLPYLSAEAYQRWLKHAEALLYPSWYEGFGLPLHEAAALGVPRLASSAPTVAASSPKDTVFLPAYAPHAWAQALEELAKTVQQGLTKPPRSA